MSTSTEKFPQTFPALEVIDLDSPFFFGLARKMNDGERAKALAHGVTDDRPMSVLGITDGLAAVDGRELATLFSAAPELHSLVSDLASWDQRWPKGSDHNGDSEREMNELCKVAHTILAKVAKGRDPLTAPPADSPC